MPIRKNLLITTSSDQWSKSTDLGVGEKLLISITLQPCRQPIQNHTLLGFHFQQFSPSYCFNDLFQLRFCILQHCSSFEIILIVHSLTITSYPLIQISNQIEQIYYVFSQSIFPFYFLMYFSYIRLMYGFGLFLMFHGVIFHNLYFQLLLSLS